MANGSPVTLYYSPEDAQRIIRARVTVDENGCWLWNLHRSKEGYGKMGLLYDGKRHTVYAHRYSYKAFNPDYDGSLTLDHLCRVRACVNPEHLEQVSSRENTLRTNSPTAINSRKKFCQNGHEFTFENTGYKKGTYRPTRYCKTCKNVYQREVQRPRMKERIV